MRKLFLFIITTIVLGFSSFGQRGDYVANKHSSLPGSFSNKQTSLDTLSPGNWDSATGVAIYSWEDNKGYVFGTNLYNDKGYAQRFSVEEPYEIVKAIFWIGEKMGTGGEVVFSIWDFDGMYPGELFASVTVAMEDVVASEELDGAMVVSFEQPVFVTRDYLIGVDIGGLEPYEEGVYGLANYSSTDENGTGLGYAYVLEGTMWVPVLNYDLDVDIAVFPVVNHVEVYSLTLNVDLAALEDFDPDSIKVWVSGTFNHWTEPGAEGSAKMTMVPRENEEDPLIYTITIPYVRVGDMLYKYFSDAVGEGWEGAEWEGDPNRYLFIQEDLVANDLLAEPSVGVEEEMAVPELKVFPNPVRDVLYIYGSQPIDQLRLFDLTGRLVMEKKALGSETFIDTGSLGSGIFILQMVSGKNLINHKVQVLK